MGKRLPAYPVDSVTFYLNRSALLIAFDMRAVYVIVYPLFDPLARRVEHRPFKAVVPGSNPLVDTIYLGTPFLLCIWICE